MESISVRNPGIHNCRMRFSMTSSFLFAETILCCKLRQFPACDKARRTASSSVIPCLSISSQVSSRCSATSAITSALSFGSSARPASRCSTNALQSRTSHLREPPQCLEKLRPFPPNRRKLLLPFRGQSVAAPPAAPSAGFPSAAHPAALLQPVKQRIQRSQRESQRAVRLLLNPPRHLIPMQRPVFQHAQNRQFRCAALNAWRNHKASPYI